jgi:1-phosphofructokinase
MIHLVGLNPALDFFFKVRGSSAGKIGEVIESNVTAGGKALNIARFLKKWGCKSITWLGTGGGKEPTHLLYRALLQEEHLKARFLSDKAPIRSNIIFNRNNEIQKYNHPGFETDLTSFSKLQFSLRKNDLLVLTGRLPHGMNSALYAAWVRAFKRKGIRTVIDTSGEALSEVLKAKPWFFKVNLFELSQALGRKISELSKVPFFQIRVGHGAVTDGPNGAIVWDEKEVYRVKYRGKIKTGFVVGAGDGFLAGYIKGLEVKKSLKGRALLACAAGTLVAQKGIDGFDSKLASQLVTHIKIWRLN